MILDIIVAIVLIAAFIYGYQKGIVHTLLSLVAVFFGLLFSMKINQQIITFLNDKAWVGPKVLPFLSFVLTIVFIVLMFKLIAWAAVKLLKTLKVNRINQIIGGVLFSVLMLLISSIFVWFLNQCHIIPETSKTQSYTFEFLNDLGPQIFNGIGNVIPLFRDTFENLSKQFSH